ncbi:hypothetical protein BB559_000559 [Furculomyces boomerangus]|uniref:Protein CSN12 homolog n=2 Tax=Harpellales TaxID=61421 RepID=A0A2T9Z4W9_9FUNG|nr:hypothetical protein BB559_000559 [Furculomyces boomerangus]PWA00960.1 hypothetical protein BB558_002977 [Smittium angustum]
MNSFSHYTKAINTAILQNDPRPLIRAFSLENPPVSPRLNLSRTLPSPWDQILLFHLSAANSFYSQDYISAYENQAKCLLSYLKVFPTHKRPFLPFIYLLNNQMISFAIKADQTLILQGKEPEKAQQAAWNTNKCFSACITDNISEDDSSRKWGTYHLACTLFKLYFHLHSFHLCKNIIRAIEASPLPDLSQFSIADQVQYNYYIGVLFFQQEKYVKASKHLTFVLENIHYQCKKNRMYLIPTNMVNGILPNQKLLEKYPTIKNQFFVYINALKSGNVKQFDQALQNNQNEHFKNGTYLAMERVRLHVLRRFIKKVYLISKTTRIHTDTFVAAFRFMGLVIDGMEVHCILANLIHKGFIKGYISESHNTLVLSKADPFPLAT